jgi:hypothetical protein
MLDPFEPPSFKAQRILTTMYAVFLLVGVMFDLTSWIVAAAACLLLKLSLPIY